MPTLRPQDLPAARSTIITSDHTAYAVLSTENNGATLILCRPEDLVHRSKITASLGFPAAADRFTVTSPAGRR